jgi:hypothetical protein
MFKYIKFSKFLTSFFEGRLLVQFVVQNSKIGESIPLHVKQLVARGRFELPSEAPEASMIDRYTTGLNLLLCYRKVRFSLINLSSPPFREPKWMEKGVSVRISSLDTKYRKTNRNAYILSHILRVSTAGPDGRF